MGELDVTGYPPSKVAAVVEAINPQSRVKLIWTPPPQTRTEDPIDAARRLQLQRDNLKG